MNHNQNKKGFLIACEGISASGKSQAIKKILEYLQDLDCEVVVVKWNSNKIIRKTVKLLKKTRLLTAEIYSFLQWVSFYIDYHGKIVPALKKNSVVIADRYIYTAMTRDVANGVKKSGEWIKKTSIKNPDILFYFNTPLHVCYKRIQSRNKTLFYINESIEKSVTIQDKDLHYLNLLVKEYKKIIETTVKNKETEVVPVNSALSNNDYVFEHSRLNEFLKIKKDHVG